MELLELARIRHTLTKEIKSALDQFTPHLKQPLPKNLRPARKEDIVKDTIIWYPDNHAENWHVVYDAHDIERGEYRAEDDQIYSITYACVESTFDDACAEVYAIGERLRVLQAESESLAARRKEINDHYAHQPLPSLLRRATKEDIKEGQVLWRNSVPNRWHVVRKVFDDGSFATHRGAGYSGYMDFYVECTIRVMEKKNGQPV